MHVTVCSADQTACLADGVDDRQQQEVREGQPVNGKVAAGKEAAKGTLRVPALVVMRFIMIRPQRGQGGDRDHQYAPRA